MEMYLKRILFTEDGVLGVLAYMNRPVCLTLEEEWQDNKSSISCIPAGDYECQRVDTPKHGNTFTVTNVPGRSAILFHTGNTEEDTQGCILLGKEYGELQVVDEDTGKLATKLAVLNSREGYGNFMDLLKGKDKFTLHIKNC